MRLERWWVTVPLRLRSILWGGRMERELDEELQFHLDHKIEEGIANGLSPNEARYAALRAMGGIDQRKEEIRDTRRVHWLTDFVDDIRYAIRSLSRTAGFTAFVAITLAMGIGMTTTTLSMMDALIFRPYPVADPSRVVNLVSTSQDKSFGSFSYREYLDIRRNTKSYDGVVASASIQPVGFSTEPGATPQVRGGQMVSGNFFKVFGVEPQIGRGFRDDEDEVPGRDAVTVLASDFWKQQFGGDPSVIGRTVRLNGKNFTVIGVAPESFPGMYIFSRSELYIPLAMAPVLSTNPQKNFFEDRDDRELTVRGRLKRGATVREAHSELSVIASTFEREYPKTNRNRGAAVRTQFEMRTRGDDVNWKFSVIFTMLALAVLMVACTNVAGLLLSRARARTREIAVRLAIGAGRFRLIRLLLTESLMLAFLGGLGGIVVGYAGIRFFHTLQIPSDLPLTIPFRLDARVLFASFMLSTLCALLCGLAPALQSTRMDLVDGLKSSDVDVPGRKRLWGRNLLVIAQVSMSLMLLTAAFLMVRGFQRSFSDGIGFEKDRLLIAKFDPRLAQYDPGQTQRFYRLLTERARAMPGVQSAALMQNPPLGLDDFDALSFVPNGFQMPRDRETFTSPMDTIDEGYFETMGISIVRGRGIRASDTVDAPRVAVVNEQFAKHYWPHEDAIGKQIRLDGRSGTAVEIVGIAQTVKYRETFEKAMDFVYLPLAQRPVSRMILMLRASSDPLQLTSPVKEMIRAFDPNLPIVELRTYEDLYRYNTIEGPQIAINLVGTMGLVGLLLAIAGLYGLIAYNVTRRTREIGIRMAIGAGPAQVLRMVMSKGLLLVVVGTGIGLAMGFTVEKLMNSMLFNAGDIDLVAYAVVVPALLLVTTFAAYLPARRAARISPTQALRHE